MKIKEEKRRKKKIEDVRFIHQQNVLSFIFAAESGMSSSIFF